MQATALVRLEEVDGGRSEERVPNLEPAVAYAERHHRIQLAGAPQGREPPGGDARQLGGRLEIESEPGNGSGVGSAAGSTNGFG